MVEQAGFELATPRCVVFGKLSASLAQYLAERKAAVLERISSPEIRLSFLNPLRVHHLFWEPGRFGHTWR